MDIFERAVNASTQAVRKVKEVARAEHTPVPHKVAEPAHRHNLDLDALQRAGFVTPRKAHTRVAEEYRLIKRPLLMNAFGKGAAVVENGNIVVITSALPGEGKTFTSLNLAMSIAQERDSTVLLIDADMVERTLSKQLGLGDAMGLSDLLSDESLDVAEVIVSTNVPSLRIVPAGTPRGGLTELLTSEQMERLVRELASRYDDRVILFDTPPLLATSQAQVLADLAGQTLLVVREGRTPPSAVEEAVDLLDEDKVVGLVLNNCSRLSSGSYYGGYYGSRPERED